jgi:hypothetical protein
MYPNSTRPRIALHMLFLQAITSKYSPRLSQHSHCVSKAFRVWDTADVKGAEGCSIEGATVSDYIHNQDE